MKMVKEAQSKGQGGELCSLFVTSDLVIQEGYFVLQRQSSAAK